MRIGIDLTCLRGERTGMSWQAYWLAAWLPRLAPDDAFVFFLPPGEPSPSGAGNVEVVRVPYGGRRGDRVLTEQWHLPLRTGHARLDLLHTIAYGAPLLHLGPKLLTMHDLGFRLFPESVPPRYRRYWNWAYGAAAGGCALVTVSEATKRDLVRVLGRRSEEISVVPAGIHPLFLSGGDAPAADLWPDGPPAAAGVVAETCVTRGSPYILHVGTLQPRKDLRTLIRAWRRLRDSHPALRLVVCGTPGWGYPPITELVRAEGIEPDDRLVLRPSAPLAELPGLYSGSAVYVLTSIHEGFGLTPLEAMASGTPVVATDTSAIPEVVGDAALLAPVGDDAAVASQVARLLGDASLRAEMVRRGRARAALFSWKRSAGMTLDVYRRLTARTERA